MPTERIVIDSNEEPVETQETPDVAESTEETETQETEDTSAEIEDKSPKEETSPEPEDDGFGDYAKEHGLPEGIKDGNQLAKSYKDALAELKRLQSQREPEKREVLPKDEPKEPQQYFNSKPGEALLKQWKEQNMLTDDLYAQYQPVASFIDKTVGSEISKIEGVLNEFYRMLGGMKQQVGSLHWNSVAPELRGKVKRDEIEAIMQSHNFPDYQSALKFYAVTNGRSDIFDLLGGKPKDKPGDQKPKHPYRWNSARGGSGQQNRESGTNVDQYIRPDGSIDEKAIDRLPVKQRDKILDTIISEGKRRNLG